MNSTQYTHLCENPEINLFHPFDPGGLLIQCQDKQGISELFLFFPTNADRNAALCRMRFQIDQILGGKEVF